MAKIIVTTVNSETKELVDTNCSFIQVGDRINIYDLQGKYVGPARESMEEIQRRINEAEATEKMAATNAKLDVILENQRKILEALRIK